MPPPLARRTSRHKAFVMVPRDRFSALGRLADPAFVLFLELLRLSGLDRVRRAGGWISLTDRQRTEIGLSEKSAHSRAVQRLIALTFIQTRRDGQHRLQYRVRPGWYVAKSEVIDLAEQRASRRRASSS